MVAINCAVENVARFIRSANIGKLYTFSRLLHLLPLGTIFADWEFGILEEKWDVGATSDTVRRRVGALSAINTNLAPVCLSWFHQNISADISSAFTSLGWPWQTEWYFYKMYKTTPAKGKQRDLEI